VLHHLFRQRRGIDDQGVLAAGFGNQRNLAALAHGALGQRCSALRVLFLQDDIAEKTIRMLKGAMQELRVGVPDRLATDIGPVIDAEAQGNLLGHIERMKANAKQHFSLALPDGLAQQGTFVPPTVLEIGSLAELQREVFGPVLHIVRYRRADLAHVVDTINATGYGLTLGVHSRIDETIDFIATRAHVGNIYVNRNIVGAVVGVQPFGGEGKSGTGPKAGGPLYLKRLQQDAASPLSHERRSNAALDALLAWARANGHPAVAALADGYMQTTLDGIALELPGPTGERNQLAFVPRGTVLCAAASTAGLLNQLAAVFATGNHALMLEEGRALLPADLPASVQAQLRVIGAARLEGSDIAMALVEAGASNTLHERLAGRPGAIVGIVDTRESEPVALWRLVAERALCVNTTAAGGNASLMTLGV
ncbi:MAG: aldehyde dehydrogenase family protein, partial [Oxalobacteraceae bacterium]